MTTPTPERTPGIEVTHEPEIPVRFVQLWLCDPCLDGDGEQCHTPGCSLWLNRPPDRSIREGASVTVLDAAPELADVQAELAKVQRGAQTLGMVVTRQARDLYAMWIDVSRGDLEAVKERVLSAIPDCDDNEPGEQWDGTETGREWFERTREGR